MAWARLGEGMKGSSLIDLFPTRRSVLGGDGDCDMARGLATKGAGSLPFLWTTEAAAAGVLVGIAMERFGAGLAFLLAFASVLKVSTLLRLNALTELLVLNVGTALAKLSMDVIEAKVYVSTVIV